ncbi:MAG TPA: hypothetical protein VGF99_22660 [Myxococcota bacterium]
MRRRIASIAATFVAAASAAMTAGCTPLRAVELGCVDDDDCPDEHVCGAGVCVREPILGEGEGEGEEPVGEGEGEGEAPGEGEGEGEAPVTVDLDVDEGAEQNATTTISWESRNADECEVRAAGIPISDRDTAGDRDYTVRAHRFDVRVECRRAGSGPDDVATATRTIIPQLPEDLDWREDLRTGVQRRRFRVDATLRYPDGRRQAVALPLALRQRVAIDTADSAREIDADSVLVDGASSYYDEVVGLLFMRTPDVSEDETELHIYVDDGPEAEQQLQTNVGFGAPANHRFEAFADDDFNVRSFDDEQRLTVFGARFGSTPVRRSDVLDTGGGMVGANAATLVRNDELFLVRIERDVDLPNVRQYVFSARDVDAVRVVLFNGRSTSLPVARLAGAFGTQAGARMAVSSSQQLTMSLPKRATTIASTVLPTVTQLGGDSLEDNWVNGTLTAGGSSVPAAAAQSFVVQPSTTLQHLIVHTTSSSNRTIEQQMSENALVVDKFNDISISVDAVWNLAP